VETVLAIELFTAAQALDFRKPLKPGRGVEIAHQAVRKAIPHASEDQLFKHDIDTALKLIRDRSLVKEVTLSGIELE
jgi:histidine ammonia-lyase